MNSSWLSRLLVLLALCGGAACPGGSPAAQVVTVTVVEYYNAALDAYFITGRPQEQGYLDGLGGDFVRTGMTFGARSSPSGTEGEIRVCRFFISQSNPFVSTHFYGRDDTDCAALRSTRPAGFTDEGIEFYTVQPTSNGACVSPNSIPVYRSFRPGVGGRSPNHRYSITRERFDALTAAGWAPEGVVFCAPIAAPSTEPAQASFKRTVSAAASPLAGDCRDWPTGSARVGSEASTQLAINPGNPRHLTATWLQDTGSNGASRGTASAVSFDAGQSWQTSSPKFTRCSGGNAAIGGDFERVTDIATVLTSDGLALQMARVASGELYTTFARSAIMIARSSNGGRNWDEMATLAIEPTPTYNLDKPVLVADADDSRYLHAAWWRTNVETGVTALRYTRTSDTGYIWTDPVQILTNVPGSSMNQGRLLSLPNGVLVYAYIDVVRLSPNPQLVGSWLRVIRSSDRGQTWSAPITVSRAESVGTTSADRTRVARDSAGLVSIAGRGNKVYLAWQDSRVGGGSHDGIVLARSTDGGANWWDAVRVNGSDTIPAFTPTVSVRRDGIVAVSYYELASASALPSSPMPVAFRIARSTTSDADTWRNVAVEDAFDLSAAPGSSRGRITNGLYLGEVHGLVSTGTSFSALYVRTRAMPTDSTEVVFANVADGSLR